LGLVFSLGADHVGDAAMVALEGRRPAASHAPSPPGIIDLTGNGAVYVPAGGSPVHKLRLGRTDQQQTDQDDRHADAYRRLTAHHIPLRKGGLRTTTGSIVINGSGSSLLSFLPLRLLNFNPLSRNSKMPRTFSPARSHARSTPSHLTGICVLLVLMALATGPVGLPCAADDQTPADL